MNFFKAIFGSKNDREVKKIRPLVARINEIELGLQKLSDDDLRAKTAAWKAELSKIEDNTELARKLEEILPEAFAVVKNAARRLCGKDVIVREHPLRWEMVHFDVQLIGGYALHTGHISEMATGEGKTLVGTLPVYLNALTGRGVHVVTVNDYLASRDGEWMGAIYKFLGLTVGCILHDQPPRVRCARRSRCSAAIILPSWTRWIPFSLMKPARRSSSAGLRCTRTTNSSRSGSPRWKDWSALSSSCAPAT